MPRPPSEATAVRDVLAAHERNEDLVLGTSGTTGSARAVVRSTRSWWSSFAGYTEMSGVDAGARLWLPGPLSATMNLFAAVHAAVVGAVLVDHPGEATHACVTPAVLARRRDRLPRRARVVVGGDALSPAQHDAAAHLDVVSYYGAAELSFVACGPHSADLRLFPGVEARVLDHQIWVRSPYVARPGSGSLRVADGWATVGDRGRFDGDRLVVLGRPEAVVTAGATVLLAEVEAALASAATAPYALVGVPHPDLGAVLAGVVTDANDRARLARRARELPSPQRPRMWRVTHELPLTTAGKLDRAALAELFRTDR